jgi:sugar phosphate isomerase/epimerase
MKISVVTDEISADLETAIELGTEWGIRDFELRGFYTDRVPDLTEYQKERLGETLAWLDHGLFQNWRDLRDQVKYHREELLPTSLEFAKSLGADLVLIFSFHRGGRPSGPAPDEILETLQDAADQAEAAGLELAIEVEDEFWADTGRHQSPRPGRQLGSRQRLYGR